MRVTTTKLLPAEVEPLADALVEAAAGESVISHWTAADGAFFRSG